MIYMKYSPQLLKELCDMFGMSRNKLATKAGFKSLKSVYFYFDGKEPNSESRCKLGKVFGVYFVDDWDGHIDNEESLNKLKASLLDKSNEA
jgi:hypothetical protein